MRKARFRLFGVLLLAATLGVSAQQSDKAGCKDPSLFPTRMPGYAIETCAFEDFGGYDFQAVKGPKVRVEGKFTFITYIFTGQRATEPSGLEVVRNYENAIRKVGGTVLQSDPQRWVNGKLVRGGQEAWFEVCKGNGKIWLRIVERKAMEQTIVADAASFADDIRATGHASVYGISFDTDRAALKPESAQALGEIAKVLRADPGLAIFVVGHTDSAGQADHNLKLSQDRAQAVMQALARDYGIAATRLRSYGCGPYAPVASNDTEEGRAKNRRVELVKQ